MDWFIKKVLAASERHVASQADESQTTSQGDAITEDIPFEFDYYRHWLVSEGRKDDIVEVLYCDRTERAPVAIRDNRVKELVRLRANISTIPENSFRKEKGKDGKMYYHFCYSIKITYQSASTKYDLVHNGKWPPAKTSLPFYLTSN